MDDKPLSLRQSSDSQIPSSISFHMASLWVRVHDLPWRFLEADWTLRLLSHVGTVQAVDNYGPGLPLDPYLRARVLVDLSRPLISGCFVPLDGNRVSWVFFRYEGIYQFCKECGCVGHNTGRCNLSAYEAQRIIQRRLRDFEDSGMAVPRTHEGIPLYSNMIRGLTDRVVHRNYKLNLMHVLPSRLVPMNDPYSPWYYANRYVVSDSSSDEFFDTSPEPEHPQNHGYYQNPRGHTSSEFMHLDPPQDRQVDFQEVRSPDVRFSPDLPHVAIPHIDSTLAPAPHAPLDLNLSLPLPSSSTGCMEPLAQEKPRSATPPRRIFGSRGLGYWAQISAQAIRRLCGTPPPQIPPSTATAVHTVLGLSMDYNGSTGNSGSLYDVVRQGWRVRAPPAPDDTGPSNWQVQPHAPALVSAFGPSLRAPQLIIEAPTPTADSRPPTTELYSPTSPFHLSQLGLSSSTSPTHSIEEASPQPQFVLTLPVQACVFGENKRNDRILERSFSHDFILSPDKDALRACVKRRRRQLDNWEAKGGFNVWLKGKSANFSAKAITDPDLAKELGFEPGEIITSKFMHKRPAGVSPELGLQDWFVKKTRLTIANDQPTRNHPNLSDTLDNTTILPMFLRGRLILDSLRVSNEDFVMELSRAQLKHQPDNSLPPLAFSASSSMFFYFCKKLNVVYNM